MSKEFKPEPFSTPGARWLAARFLHMACDDRLGRAVLLYDPHIFSLFYASCATAIEPPERLSEGEVASASDREDLLKSLREMRRELGPSATGVFVRAYQRGLALYEGTDTDGLVQMIEEWHAQANKQLNNGFVSSQEVNVEWLGEVLDLNSGERDFLLLQLNRHLPGFDVLIDALLTEENLQPLVIGSLLGIDPTEVMLILSEEGSLVRSGLVTVEQRPRRIMEPSRHLVSTLNAYAENADELFERFVRPLEPEQTTASLARLDDSDAEILIKLLQAAPEAERPVNALIYGPRSIDKHDLIAGLLGQHGIPTWRVVTKNVPASDMPVWVYVAQRYLEEQAPDAVLVVDRADQALARRASGLLTMLGLHDDSEDVEERATDDGLTSSELACIWLVENPRMLSERSLGRFLFHAQALPGSRADRRERIKKIIAEHKLSPELEAHLSRYALLGERALSQAATLAEIVASGDDEERERVIRRAVAQSQRALGRDETEDLRDSVTKYSLEYLNVAGRFTPEQILKALRRRPKGTLCFYGLPGAGKTQLAEYLAVELDMPILVKRASDLLSKWLGESEQNIAAMFREAEAEGAILFLDEADSFLRDRALARAEWSVTQVNELLQQMERFDGIFIAATNLMRDVDAAAMRRFTWKLEFLPLKEEQAWKMFCNETGFRDTKRNAKKARELREGLAKIKNLTPGDFATVKRQAIMLGDELGPEDWLEQLSVEAKAKMRGLERNPVGFGLRDG